METMGMEIMEELGARLDAEKAVDERAKSITTTRANMTTIPKIEANNEENRSKRRKQNSR